MHESAAAVTDRFEVILVDDGSPDASLDRALEAVRSLSHVVVVELSRNFGHHNAILAGLQQSQGELVFFIDSDLEEKPELLTDFFAEMQKNGDIDVVSGYHDRAGQSSVRKATGNLFWWTMRNISRTPVQQNLANVRLMRRNYVDALLSMPDRNVFLGGMFAWPGFNQKFIKIEREERDSPSSYSWTKRIQLAVLATIAFSSFPLIFVFILGMAIMFVSMMIGLYFTIIKILHPDQILDGFSTLIVSMWFLGGVILGCLGTIGLYISHIYEQSIGRPRFIIRRLHSNSDGD